MKPSIDRTTFGSITIDGSVYERDVIIRLNGRVKKRKKRLSKAVYGTSHTISLAEAKHVYQKGAERLIIHALPRIAHQSPPISAHASPAARGAPALPT